MINYTRENFQIIFIFPFFLDDCPPAIVQVLQRAIRSRNFTSVFVLHLPKEGGVIVKTWSNSQFTIGQKTVRTNLDYSKISLRIFYNHIDPIYSTRYFSPAIINNFL